MNIVMLFKILSICKGGGYKYCRTFPKHPKANSKGLYPLHRVVMENKLGRLLRSDEDVHHINHDKDNNKPKNLENINKSKHGKLHAKTVKDIHLICPLAECKNKFVLKPHLYRLRKKRNKSNQVFCSPKCATLAYFKKLRGGEVVISSRS